MVSPTLVINSIPSMYLGDICLEKLLFSCKVVFHKLHNNRLLMKMSCQSVWVTIKMAIYTVTVISDSFTVPRRHTMKLSTDVHCVSLGNLNVARSTNVPSLTYVTLTLYAILRKTNVIRWEWFAGFQFRHGQLLFQNATGACATIMLWNNMMPPSKRRLVTQRIERLFPSQIHHYLILSMAIRQKSFKAYIENRKNNALY